MFEQAFKNIDELRFASQTEKHELLHLYEVKIKNMGKTNPLNDADLAEFIALAASRTSATEGGPETPRSWNVDVSRSLSSAEVDLSVKNPNGGEEIAHRSPQEIMEEIASLDQEAAKVLAGIRALL